MALPRPLASSQPAYVQSGYGGGGSSMSQFNDTLQIAMDAMYKSSMIMNQGRELDLMGRQLSQQQMQLAWDREKTHLLTQQDQLRFTREMQLLEAQSDIAREHDAAMIGIEAMRIGSAANSDKAALERQAIEIKQQNKIIELARGDQFAAAEYMNWVTEGGLSIDATENMSNSAAQLGAIGAFDQRFRDPATVERFAHVDEYGLDKNRVYRAFNMGSMALTINGTNNVYDYQSIVAGLQSENPELSANVVEALRAEGMTDAAIENLRNMKVSSVHNNILASQKPPTLTESNEYYDGMHRWMNKRTGGKDIDAVKRAEYEREYAILHYRHTGRNVANGFAYSQEKSQEDLARIEKMSSNLYVGLDGGGGGSGAGSGISDQFGSKGAGGRSLNAGLKAAAGPGDDSLQTRPTAPPLPPGVPAGTVLFPDGSVAVPAPSSPAPQAQGRTVPAPSSPAPQAQGRTRFLPPRNEPGAPIDYGTRGFNPMKMTANDIPEVEKEIEGVQAEIEMLRGRTQMDHRTSVRIRTLEDVIRSYKSTITTIKRNEMLRSVR